MYFSEAQNPPPFRPSPPGLQSCRGPWPPLSPAGRRRNSRPGEGGLEGLGFRDLGFRVEGFRGLGV